MSKKKKKSATTVNTTSVKKTALQWGDEFRRACKVQFDCGNQFSKYINAG